MERQRLACCEHGRSLDLLVRLEGVAANAPQAIALIEETGRSVSYAALVARIARTTVALRRHGVQRGDRVLFAVRPSETAVASIVALTELGAVLVAAQVGVGDELFAAQMQAVEPKWVMAESVLVAAMRSRLLRAVLRRRGSVLPSFDPLRDARVITVGPWLPMLGKSRRLEALEVASNGESPIDHDSHPSNGDDALIVFTSGTTAAPKAVVHTRATLAATLDAVAAHLPVTPGDRVFARDLHLIVPALLSGATAFVPRASELSPRSLFGAIVQYRITHVFEVTAHLEQLLTYLEATNQRLPDFVQQVLVGAAPVRQAFFSRLSQRIGMHTQAWCVYGTTEMLPVAAIELREKLAFEGSGDIVGRPVHGIAASIDESGNLLVAGPHMFNRYLGSMPVSCHNTGDIASFDEQGRIVLQGRSRDMIIRGAYNIYPALHEPVIEQIEGVKRAALVGVFDEDREDERVVLVIEPLAGFASSLANASLTDRVAIALRTTHRIDDAAIPDEIVIAAVPLSGRSSKVDKEQLRRMLAKRDSAKRDSAKRDSAKRHP